MLRQCDVISWQFKRYYKILAIIYIHFSQAFKLIIGLYIDLDNPESIAFFNHLQSLVQYLSSFRRKSYSRCHLYRSFLHSNQVHFLI